MIYFTSDLHISDKRILKYREQFLSVKEMDSYFIDSLNNLSKVKDFEMLYHVGDFFLGKDSNMVDILDQIKIPITFIYGNHDSNRFRTLIENNYQQRFKGTPYLEIKRDGIKVCLFHFPIMEWNQQRFNTLHFHGHLHGQNYIVKQNIPNILDVGWDKHHKYLSFDDAVSML